MLGRQTITRKRAGASTSDDVYGNPIPGADVPDVDIAGCSVQPGSGGETFQDRDAITTVWTVWAPLSADVLDGDRISYGGTVYDIDGPVERWELGSPLDHVVIRLKAVAG